MAGHKFTGKWHIVKMSEWDKKYIDMEVQAHITIEKGGDGNFQFGLVSGSIDGDIIKRDGIDVFDFTFEGTDEHEPVSGDGWMKILPNGKAEGEFRFHQGDDSKFWAEKSGGKK